MSKITYTNKVAINENAEIPNINKITDDDMNEIKAVVNNNDDELATTNTNIATITSYSTSSEIAVGTWIDGKTIYRKTFTGTLSNGSIAHGLSNVTFVNSYGHFISGSGAFMPLASLRIGAPDYSCGYYVNATNIIFDKAASASGTVYVTLEYTKNTN